MAMLLAKTEPNARYGIAADVTTTTHLTLESVVNKMARQIAGPFLLLRSLVIYVPVSQLDIYSSISGVSSSIETPIARSLSEAIS
jgi:hypothetical protein